jgi:hypothetical protein
LQAGDSSVYCIDSDFTFDQLHGHARLSALSYLINWRLSIKVISSKITLVTTGQRMPMAAGGAIENRDHKVLKFPDEPS